MTRSITDVALVGNVVGVAVFVAFVCNAVAVAIKGEFVPANAVAVAELDPRARPSVVAIGIGTATARLTRLVTKRRGRGAGASCGLADPGDADFLTITEDTVLEAKPIAGTEFGRFVADFECLAWVRTGNAVTFEVARFQAVAKKLVIAVRVAETLARIRDLIAERRR